MFYDDDTFNFVNELMELAEEFCEEWVQRKGPFESELDAALVLNFALCTIKYDLECLLSYLEHHPTFKGISPREVYERGRFGDELPQGLSERDVVELIEKALRRTRIH